MDEKNWTEQHNGAIKPKAKKWINFDPQCKLCGNDRVGTKPSFENFVGVQHILDPDASVDKVDTCALCGYHFKGCNEEKTNHQNAHDSIEEPSWWNETLVVLDDEGQMKTTPTQEIHLK